MPISFVNSSDESLLAFYENVRRQVAADARLGNRYRFAGDSVKRYADQLRNEMDKRRLNYTPIEWR